MQGLLKADESFDIVYRQWLLPEPKAVFLLIHGLGAHSGRWEFLADFFLRNNFSSYAIELKGFGETKDLRGHIGSFDVYFEDILSLYTIIKKENPGKNIFLIGESMGALIAFFAAARKRDLFSGLILISPVFRNKLRLPALAYFKIFFSLIYNPKKQFNIPFDSAMCTGDSGYKKIMDSDPREHRLATASLLYNIFLAQMRAPLLKRSIRLPVLFLVSGRDAFTDAEHSKKFFPGIGSQDKNIIAYPEMLHALSIESEREKVFEDILSWAKRRA